jgi:hypothetical protein
MTCTSHISSHKAGTADRVVEFRFYSVLECFPKISNPINPKESRDNVPGGKMHIPHIPPQDANG